MILNTEKPTDSLIHYFPAEQLSQKMLNCLFCTVCDLSAELSGVLIFQFYTHVRLCRYFNSCKIKLPTHFTVYNLVFTLGVIQFRIGKNTLEQLVIAI